MDRDDDLEVSTYRSVIGLAYIQPITTLLETLLASNPQGANDLQASTRENGYSVSIIALAVLCLESTLAAEMQSRGVTGKPYEFFQQQFGASGLAEDCVELFVLRDTIAHNHLWTAQFAWDDNYTVVATQRVQGGDRKYLNRLDDTTRKTKKLGLNFFPTRIHLADVKTVLKTFVAIMQYLHDVDPTILTIRGIKWVRYQEGRGYFADLVQTL